MFQLRGKSYFLDFLQKIFNNIHNRSSLFSGNKTLSTLMFKNANQGDKHPTDQLCTLVYSWGSDDVFFCCWHAIQLVFLPSIVPLRRKMVVYCCYVNLWSMFMVSPFWIFRGELWGQITYSSYFHHKEYVLGIYFLSWLPLKKVK